VNVTANAFAPTGAAAYEGTVRALAFLDREIAAHPDAFVAVRTAADIRQAKESKRLGLIAGFQDATMLEGDLSRVDKFHELGVRIIQLTYNVRNLLADGCLEPGNAGLSNFGRDVVARMNELGILVDLSHCGRRTTLDAIAASKKPAAATHTGCAALVDVPRNKTDEQLKQLADRGGVAGIYLMPFLRASGQPAAEDFVRHVEHAVRVCGEEHVGVGSDLSITPPCTPASSASAGGRGSRPPARRRTCSTTSPTSTRRAAWSRSPTPSPRAATRRRGSRRSSGGTGSACSATSGAERARSNER
jgi:membrane dipeptidase